VIGALTASLIAVSARNSLRRYDEFRSGWSWDLAYYNQWFRAFNRGEVITVRPIGPYCDEGPSVWVSNYLAPVRLAIVPIYRAFPDPRTLLIVQVVALWMVVPAAYSLVRSESGSWALALSAAALVPLTPLLWPLAANDFRELQLAPALILWAVQGVRSRRVWLTALAVGGLLACRQEYAILVATLAFLPPRVPEDVGRRFRWARALWVTGVGWFLLVFMVYSRWVVTSDAFETFLHEMTRHHAPLRPTLETSVDFLLVGLGSWAVLACLSPRAALLVLPLVLSLSRGRWRLLLIGTEQWHHVRYTAPMVGMCLAAGLLGYARLGAWLASRARGQWAFVTVWLAAACGLITAAYWLASRLARIPAPITTVEAEQLWTWIGRVGPDDGVLAHYDVAAPLSSRRRLFSYVMLQNYPAGYATLEPGITWVFARVGDINVEFLTEQYFRPVHDGQHILIYRRDPVMLVGPPPPKKVRRLKTGAEFPDIAVAENDWAYLLLGRAFLLGDMLARTGLPFVPGVWVSLWARRRIRVLAAPAPALSGLSGAEVVAAILRSEGAPVAVTVDDGPIADLYDAGLHTIRLSPEVAHGRSLADQAIAAREAAFAVLHARGNRIVVVREPLVVGMRLAALASWLTVVSGVALGSWYPLQCGAFLVTLTVLISLPIYLWEEHGASRLAVECLCRARIARDEDRASVVKAVSSVSWNQIAALAPRMTRRPPRP
jgi:Zn-dependent membrane protease YugP